VFGGRRGGREKSCDWGTNRGVVEGTQEARIAQADPVWGLSEQTLQAIHQLWLYQGIYLTKVDAYIKEQLN